MKVLNPPTASVGPVAPNRPMLIATVFLAATALAGALAYALSKMNPVFNHSRDLERVTGLPVLGSISLTWLEHYNSEQRRGFLRYGAVAGALVVAFGCVMALELVTT